MKNNKTKTSSPTTLPKTEQQGSSFNWMMWLPVIAAVLVFLTGLNNEMTGMDDHTATTDNPAVKNFDLVAIFTQFNLGMYAPLSWLVYALAYGMGKANPAPYHLFSMAVHAFNVYLVFNLLLRLTKKEHIAFAVSLIFAIHPLQVESVSWIAGFSTVLFSMFYLLGILRYLDYTEQKEGNTKQYLWALLFFLAACLSKTNAVTLPLTLVVLDWWQKPALETRKKWLGYVPFFLISLAFGLLTIYSRKSSAITLDSGLADYSAFDRVWMVGFALASYLGKLLVPIRLSVYYAFEKMNGSFSPLFYVSTALVAGVLFLAYRYKNAISGLWWGLLLYLSTIVFSLPFYPVGSFELFADHYNYLGLIGLGIALVAVFDYLSEKLPIIKNNSRTISGIWVAALAILCFMQIRVWDGMVNVTSHAIELGNTFNGKMYYWRGIKYGDLGQMDKAMADFSKAIEINPDYNYEAFKFRGSLQGQKRNYDAAESDLRRYLQKDTADAVSWFNLGMLSSGQNKWGEAVVSFSKALEIKPRSTDALRGRAQAYQMLGEQAKAEADRQMIKSLGN